MRHPSSGIIRYLAIVVGALAPATAMAEDFSCVRVVRAQAGDPSVPSIVLPAGYRIVSDNGYSVATSGEFHAFVAGPAGQAHIVVSWPGVPVSDIIHDHTHLPLTPVPDGASCDLPVASPTLRSAWTTLDTASYLDEDSLSIRVEHNHPARRAGWYLDNPWVAGQAKSVINFIFAVRTIMRDWGIAHAIASAGKGHVSILGFESSNPLHIDFPPHWHLIDYRPGDAGTRVPHYYMESNGAVTSNKLQVLDAPGSGDTFLGVGQPFSYTDADGTERMVAAIHADGGVDLGPSQGALTYAIVAGSAAGFTESALILKGNANWRRVTATDDVAQGILTAHIDHLDGSSPVTEDETHYYDPLTGSPVSTPQAGQPAPYGMSGDVNAVAIPPTSSAAGNAGAMSSRCGLGGAIALIGLAVVWLARSVPLTKAVGRAISQRISAVSRRCGFIRSVKSLVITAMPFGMMTAGAMSLGTAQAATADHIVVLVLENQAYSTIIGSTAAPYINGLLPDAALFTHSYGNTHPSQPNYLILFSGSAQGVTDDSLPVHLPFTAPNLGAEVIASGGTFAGYSEDLPSTGFTGVSSGGYVRRHNPWVNWQDASVNGIPATDNLPMSSFPSDFTTLPRVCFVIPAIPNDMHDASDHATILRGDTWVHDHLDTYVTWAKSHNSILIITFDEDDHSASNHIVTIFVGASVVPGAYDANMTHLDVLRTIEDMSGISHTPGSASASGVDSRWSTGTSVAASSGSGSGHGCGLGAGSAALTLCLSLFAARRGSRAIACDPS